MLIWNGNFGGLADSKFSGIAGSFAECVGIDGHSIPGVLQAQQKLVKNTGVTVDEFCKEKIECSNGYGFYFSSTSGKIWARDGVGAWTLAYTTVPTSGGAGCLGAFEFNGSLYWATQNYLHKITVANANAAWGATPTANWALFTVTDSEFHPMAMQDLTLFIGDGNKVAQVDDTGTFNGNVLDLKTPYRVKCLTDCDIDLLIGTYVSAINKTEIIRWDTVSPSWNTSDPINEVGINAFIRDDNYVYVNAGKAGNLYYYNGQYLLPFKRIPGVYSPTSYGYVHPGAVANLKGIPIFGFSNGSGNPAKQGVYSFGSYSRDYRKVLDLSYVISEAVTSGIEIGAIGVRDSDVYVAWKNGTSYGIDKLDYSTRYGSAYLETMLLFQGKRDMVKTMLNVSAFYNSLPASTGVTFYYSINGAAYVAMTPVTNSIINAIESKLKVGLVGSLQIKMIFTVSSNSTPVIEAIGVDIN